MESRSEVYQLYLLPDELREAVSLVCLRSGWQETPYEEGKAYDSLIIESNVTANYQHILVKYPTFDDDVLDEALVGWRVMESPLGLGATPSTYRLLKNICRKKIVDHVVGWDVNEPNRTWDYWHSFCSEGAFQFCANGGLLAQNRKLTMRFTPSMLINKQFL